MLERQYGVTARDTPPAQKRKTAATTDAANEDGEEPFGKKQKTSFGNVTNGGILSDHMKAEREKFAADSEPNPAPIDLTNDDDDIVFISEAKRDDTREVCLGKLPARAGMHRIPRASRKGQGVTPSDFWPGLRVHWRRTNQDSKIIDLFDREPGPAAVNFAKVDVVFAAALCPLLDGVNMNKLRMKMFLDPHRKQKGDFEGERVSRPVSISILLFSPRDKAQLIGTYLSQRQLFLSQPANAGRVEYYNPQQPPDFGPTKTVKRSQGGTQVTYGVARSEEQMKRETQDVLDNLFSTRDLPEMEANADLVTTPLLPHQKQALHFMTQHERSAQDASEEEADYSLWQSRATSKGEVWYNIITNHEVAQKPEPMRGGILADVMGLGKTLSILALVLSTIEAANEFGKQEPGQRLEAVERNAQTTLIICPKSVLSNWDEQIKIHTRKGRLRVCTYHGPARTQDLDELASHDIVLTTYSTAASEFGDPSKKRNALASIQWFRIVLDEAHQIRTQNTQVFQACRALEAQRRWAVTGTPVQNRLDDIGALVKFLRLKPFDEGNAWTQHIISAFKGGSTETEKHLKLIVHGITLRRQKDNTEFTERREVTVRLEFNEAELLDYRVFSQKSNQQIRLMISSVTGGLKGKSYGHVLKWLQRLRSYCAHGREMLHEEDLKELEGLTASTAIDLGDEPDEENPEDSTFISEKQAYEALHMMMDSETSVCTRCSKTIGSKIADEEAPAAEDSDVEEETSENDTSDTMGYLTPCYHLICPDCKPDHVEMSKGLLGVDAYHTCPYCESYVRFGLFELLRSTLTNMLESRRKRNKRDKTKWDESNYSGPSTKVKALLDDLQKNATETASLGPSEDPIRSVVFSGWTTYLDLIEHALEENSIGYTRLDGTMSLKARARVIEAFKTDPTITVLLVSIKAGGQGLNFTAANKVYMMEPQFNPGVEQQAIDRVHRLGQKRDVDIVHFIMRESVEEGVVNLQKKKMKLAQMSLERKVGSKGEQAKDRARELIDLMK